MIYFFGVLLLWFLLRLYCSIVTVEQISQPYELNRIYLDPYEPCEQALRSFGKIRPLDEIELTEDDVGKVLLASKELSKTNANDPCSPKDRK